MRNYTNKEGESIIVSQEHLDTAVRIKRELQMESPSHKCSWKKHRDMMIQEGFEDSEASENYRLLIKNYQSSIGELPSVEKHADLVADSKLQSIKEAVGEMAFAKREVQLESQKLGKLKRDLTLYGVVTQQVTNLFEDSFDYTLFQDVDIIKINSDSNKILVPFTDWHIGLKTESFNYEIAKNKVEKYVQSIVQYCKQFNVNEIYLAGLGDLVENVYMRTTQSYDVEFTFSEQIVKASELVISMICSLQKHVVVNYLGIVMGNHDRMFIKGQTLENDSAMRIVDFCVTQFIETSKPINVKVCKEGFDGLSIKVNINGFNIKMVHGDKESKSGTDKVKKHISLDQVFYDMLIFGHFHNFGVTEENGGRICLNLGCLQGTTSYSKDLGYNTNASQGIVLITENDIIPVRVGLDG